MQHHGEGGTVMTVQTINILEKLNQQINKVKKEMEKHPEDDQQHIYYKGLLEGLTLAWDIAYNLS